MSAAPVLTVDTDDPTPPFEQVRRQIAALVVSGRLTPGQRLPPLRQLAADLGLAVGTVARSYRELEAAGLVLSRRGGGTRVVGPLPSLPSLPSPLPSRGPDGEALREQAVSFVARARALGRDDAAIVAAVRDALDVHGVRSASAALAWPAATEPAAGRRPTAGRRPEGETRRTVTLCPDPVGAPRHP